MKKTKRLFGLFFMVSTLVFGSLGAFAQGDIETQYGITEEQVNQSVESWIAQLETLTEEEIETYKDSDEMVSTWVEASDGAGAFVEVLGDEADYEITDDGFIAEIPVKMENGELLVRLDYDAASGAVGVTFSAEGSSGGMGLGTIFKKAGINTLLGMGTVFIMLIFISFLIWLLGFVRKAQGGKEEKASGEVSVKGAGTADLTGQAVDTVSDGADDKELVAVIAAAVAAATGSSTDSFVVRSIRKVRRG